MDRIKVDFNNLFDFSIGKEHGVEESDLEAMMGACRQAHEHLQKVLADPRSRIGLSLEWSRLPFQEKETIAQIERLGKEISGRYENVLFLGIGGSYLGLKAAQDALCPPYFNEFVGLRKKHPKVYFDGNNLDPDTLSVLLKNLNPKKTFVVVISKSGETTETKAAFLAVEHWLKKSIGSRYGRHILAITDPESGSLRKKVAAEQEKDPLSFRSLPLLKGVGGRFSELNMGLLHLAIVGVKIGTVLAGAADMAEQLSTPDPLRNPAYLYALLHTILYRKKNKSIAILMPFSETLKSTADWYVQLLAESLGKKFSRRISVDAQATEQWLQDTANVVSLGRTPISCRGTNDLHSIQQNNIEGENNKVVTFIRVEKFQSDITISGTGELLSKKKYSYLIQLAQEATEWALVRGNRPNCTVILPEVSPYYWGALLYFFEMATAFEGELLNVNAFDQPGVEGYKNYLYYKLGKAVPQKVTDEVTKNPLIKKERFIV